MSDEELVRALDDEERVAALTRDIAALEPSAGLVAGQEVKRRFTNLWRKEAGTWRLFARHANVIQTR